MIASCRVLRCPSFGRAAAQKIAQHYRGTNAEKSAAQATGEATSDET